MFQAYSGHSIRTCSSGALRPVQGSCKVSQHIRTCGVSCPKTRRGTPLHHSELPTLPPQRSQLSTSRPHQLFQLSLPAPCDPVKYHILFCVGLSASGSRPCSHAVRKAVSPPPHPHSASLCFVRPAGGPQVAWSSFPVAQ